MQLLIGGGIPAVTVARMCVGPTSQGRILALSAFLLLPRRAALIRMVPFLPRSLSR